MTQLVNATRLVAGDVCLAADLFADTATSVALSAGHRESSISSAVLNPGPSPKDIPVNQFGMSHYSEKLMGTPERLDNSLNSFHIAKSQYQIARKTLLAATPISLPSLPEGGRLSADTYRALSAQWRHAATPSSELGEGGLGHLAALLGLLELLLRLAELGQVEGGDLLGLLDLPLVRLDLLLQRVHQVLHALLVLLVLLRLQGRGGDAQVGRRENQRQCKGWSQVLQGFRVLFLKKEIRWSRVCLVGLT